MTHRIWSGFTAATLLMATLGVAPGHTSPVRSSETASEVNVPQSAPAAIPAQTSSPNAATSSPTDRVSAEANSASPDAAVISEVPSVSATDVSAETKPGQVSTQASSSSPAASAASPAAPQANSSAQPDSQPTAQPAPSSEEPLKVGEYQSQEQSEPSEAIATMQTHLINGQSTTIVYVRGIPVFSFVGDGPAPVQPNTAASQPAAEPTVQPAPPAASTEAKSAIPQEASAKGAETLLAQTIATETKPAAPQVSEQTSDDRAMAIAAQLNQLYRNNVDASTIVAVWDEPSQSYLVKVGDTVLAVVDPNTRLADTTNSPEQDALQIANRLRRLLGNAEPLTAVEGAPARDTRIAVGPIEFTVKGYASWYGPGFHGNMSASGEIFNENAMTAAHRELPFGTLVRVTNLDTGLAIVVRINDRGPFYGNRVIDLSAAAADAIGLMSSGVAPVQLDVLGTTASN